MEFSRDRNSGLRGYRHSPVGRKGDPQLGLGGLYVFLSLQGIVALFDLGFRPAITRAAGYIWAGARYLTPLGLDADSRPLGESEPNYSSPQPTRRNDEAILPASRLVRRSGSFIRGWLLGVAQDRRAGTRARLRASYLIFVFGVIVNAMGDLFART